MRRAQRNSFLFLIALFVAGAHPARPNKEEAARREMERAEQARATEQAAQFTFAELEFDAVDGPCRLKALDQAADTDRRHVCNIGGHPGAQAPTAAPFIGRAP